MPIENDMQQYVMDGTTRLMVDRAEQKAEYLLEQVKLLIGKENVNRNLIRGLSIRIDHLERGDPPDPTLTPPALRAEEV